MKTGRLPEQLERWREALLAVDRSPGAEWRARAVHHGLRGLAVIGIAILVPYLFPQHALPQFNNLREGERVSRDIIAEVPFTVLKSEAQLEAERHEAERGVTPIFVQDPSVVDSTVARVSKLFTQLDSAVASVGKEGSAESDTVAIRTVLESNGVASLLPEHVAFLQDRGRRQLLRRSVESTFRMELAKGVVPSADLDGVAAQLVRIRSPDGERLVPRDSVLTVQSFLLTAGNHLPRRLSAPGRDLFQNILVRFASPSLTLDRAATRQAREWARSAVEAAAGYVLEGTTIVAAGERLDSQDLVKLRAYQRKLVEEGEIGGLASLWPALGSGLFAALMLGLLSIVVYCYRPGIYQDARAFFLIFLLLLTVLVLASLNFVTIRPALIPVAFAVLLIGALFDGLLALVVALLLAVLLAAQPSFVGVTVPLLAVAAGAAAALAIREVRRRSESWILIAMIAGGYLVAGTALFLMRVLSFRELLSTVAWGGVNATACTAVAIGAALPALEKLTGRTTDQTLLELADLNQPVLRRLSREAPGTYAHSVSLANLAESACQAIGANALLARVGVYYHDIGKLLRPQYFIENQPQGLNPHDRLPPEKSAEVIREHVREGLRLAEEAGLPRVIRDFIREHHGTQKISFFLSKAKEQDLDAVLNPADFCYPGPKPQSRETAVVLLADAVESAARTLPKPSPERIRQLVDRLVNERLEEGQLDQSPLTLRDLGTIKREFVRVLTGLYHHRIDYGVESARDAGREDTADGTRVSSGPSVPAHSHSSPKVD